MNTFVKACLNGNYEIVKMLLDAGADVNRTDFYNQNTLHYAVKGNNEKICKLICYNKVDSNVHSKITQLEPKDFALKPVGTSIAFKNYDIPQEKEYIRQTREIIKEENPDFLLDRIEPDTKEDRIFGMIRRYENMRLSDPESDGDDQQKGEVYKKKKKKKKGKKGKKKGGKKKRHESSKKKKKKK